MDSVGLNSERGFGDGDSEGEFGELIQRGGHGW